MALLLETTLGDLVVDLDVEGSPEICKNVLKLAKARYYTSTLFYNIQPNRFCQLGDPQGDGSGGACIYGLISTLKADGGTLSNERVLKSQQRFLKSNMGRPLTREECQEKGRVVATEMKGIADTIGSQLLITISEGKDMALDGFRSNDYGDDSQLFRSVGMVREDNNHVLDQLAAAYCDAEGRPFADIRVIRALVVDDPFDDPPGMEELLRYRGVIADPNNEDRIIASPEYDRPPEEQVEIRIQADQIDPLTGEEDLAKMREQEEEMLKREDKSRAVVLEMLGDLPDAEAKAPENVLFVCKLNPVTEDEDLELIFSRFDEKVKAEIIRDNETGSSLQYAFVEFTTPQQAVEAYFKMNNALVDDRRIKVDFSQSVAKVWNKFAQRMRNPSGKGSNHHMPRDPFKSEFNRQAGARSGPGGNNPNPRSRNNQPYHRPEQRHDSSRTQDNSRHFDRPKQGGRQELHDEDSVDSFGRRRPRKNRDNHDRGDMDHKHKQDRDHRESSPVRHDSDSDSRERRRSRRRRQSRSRSTERKDKKKKHRHHKSDRKRRHDESSSHSDRSDDSEKRRRRHRKRERHPRNDDDQDRGDKSKRKSDDRNGDDRHQKDRRDRKSTRKHDDDRRRDRRDRSNSPDNDDDDRHKDRRTKSDKRGSEKKDKDRHDDRRAGSDRNKGDRSDDDHDRVRKHGRHEHQRQSHRNDDRDRR